MNYALKKLLLLMEYGLGLLIQSVKRRHTVLVLILLLMEYGLGRILTVLVEHLIEGLNPSFNGIWSRTLQWQQLLQREPQSLNPSFNGIWSRTFYIVLGIGVGYFVLILLLMEYGLGHFSR